jgi:large subunit ribosomal protein L47
MPVRSIGQLSHSCRSSFFSETPVSFLVPSLLSLIPSSHIRASQFSTSQPQCFPRDRNPNRGISAVRRTGPREPLSVSKLPLPQPVLDPSRRSQVLVDENHGLWQFFNKERTVLSKPEDDYAHGERFNLQLRHNRNWA